MLRETATASLFFLTPFLFSSYFLRFKFIFHNEFTLFLFFPSLLTVPVRHGFRPTPRSHEGIPRDTVPQDAITGVSHYTHHFLGPLLPFVRAPGTKWGPSPAPTTIFPFAGKKKVQHKKKVIKLLCNSPPVNTMAFAWVFFITSAESRSLYIFLVSWFCKRRCQTNDRPESLPSVSYEDKTKHHNHLA